MIDVSDTNPLLMTAAERAAEVRELARALDMSRTDMAGFDQRRQLVEDRITALQSVS